MGDGYNGWLLRDVGVELCLDAIPQSFGRRFLMVGQSLVQLARPIVGFHVFVVSHCG